MKFKYPPLPLEAWEDSKITLHLYLQIVGKIMLDMNVRKNHWWHMTFKLTDRGLTTGPVPYDDGYFTILFDLINHQLRITTSTNGTVAFALHDGLSVAFFYDKLFSALHSLNINPKIQGIPFDHPCKEPFDVCTTHHHYDKKYVQRYWEVLQHIAYVFEKFTGEYCGKVSPVQLYWHHMDLAVTRFNGNEAPPMPETARISDRDAYSHEVISAGFWAGDEQVRGAAFYSYTYPSPDNLEKESIMPVEAVWDMSSGSPMAILMYDDLIRYDNPDAILLDFLRSTYTAGAKLAGWPIEQLQYNPPV